MADKILPAIEAFGNKCGLEEVLFAPSRFGTASRGIGKGEALARVAVWAAVKDVWGIHNCMTPGQITTVVDGAPIIVGESGLAELAKCDGSKQLSAFVEANASKWEMATTALAQIWSLTRAAKANMPDEFLYNSKFSEANVAQVALAAAFTKNGLNECENPAALLATLDPESGIPARIVSLAKKGRISESPVTREDKASVLMMLAKKGDFNFLASSGLMEEYIQEAEAFHGEQKRNIPCTYANGAFLGPRNLGEIRQMGQTSARSDEQIGDYLARTPAGFFTAMLVRGYDIDGRNSSDLTMAAMGGVIKAWENYSPLIIAGQSITQVKTQKAAQTGQLDLFGFAETPAQPAEEEQAPGYLCARIPKQIEVWVKKVCLDVIEKSRVIKITPEVKKAISALRSRTDAIMDAAECSLETAVELASAEMEAETDEQKRIDPRILGLARLHVEHGGNTVSLDQTLGDGDRDMHSMLGGSEEYDASMVSDDMREEHLGASANRETLNPVDASFQVVDYTPGSMTAVLECPESLSRRFDVIHQVISGKDKDLGTKLFAMAETYVPQVDEIERMKTLITETFPGNTTAKAYAKLLDSAYSVVVSDKRTHTESMDLGEGTHRNGFGDLIQKRLVDIVSTNDKALAQSYMGGREI